MRNFFVYWVFGALVLSACTSLSKVSEKNNQLVQAIGESDLVKVQSLIKDGADADGYDKDGYSPVIWYATFYPKDAKILETLIHYGANVNAPDLYTKNLILQTEGIILGSAVYNCNEIGAKLLIAAGAHVTLETLNSAITGHCTSIFQVIIEHPMDFTLGVKEAAQPRTAPKRGSLLGNAIWNGEYEMAKKLIEKGHPVVNDRAPVEAIWRLISGGEAAEIRHQTEAGEKRTKRAKQPEKPRLELLRILLERGAPFDGKSGLAAEKSERLLSGAIQRKYFQMAELLILAGADVNEWGYSGRPLDYANKAGNRKVIKMLKDRGAVTLSVSLPNDPPP